MAKTGTITVSPGGHAAASAVAQVAQSDPRVGNLASVGVDALRAFLAGPAIVVIDTKNRRVLALDDSEESRVAIDAVKGNLNVAEFERDDDTATNSAFSKLDVEGTSPFLAEIVETAKPKFSVSSLLTKLEDLLSAGGKDGLLIVDQTNGMVVVAHGDPADIGTQGIALANEMAANNNTHLMAVFTQVVEATTGPKPFGE